MTSAIDDDGRRARYGGMKFGGCFFGWLTAAGMFVLLTSLLAAGGLGAGVVPGQLGQQQPEDVGLVAGIVLLLVLLLAYFCGGYVAGRMARFNGFRQGLGVWLWAVVVGIVLTVLGLVAGSQIELPPGMGELPAMPSLGGDESVLSPPVLIAAGAVAAVTLLGSLLGGRAGMGFHRRVDRWSEPLEY